MSPVGGYATSTAFPQGMLTLVSNCIDRLNVYNSAAHFGECAGSEAGIAWKDILNLLYELLGKKPAYREHTHTHTHPYRPLDINSHHCAALCSRCAFCVPVAECGQLVALPAYALSHRDAAH